MSNELSISDRLKPVTQEVSRNEVFNEDSNFIIESRCNPFFQRMWIVDREGQRDVLDHLRTFSAGGSRGAAGSGRNNATDYSYNH
jgi:hypothetical protein